LTLVFDVDAAMLPSGTTKDTLSFLHDAALLAECPAATTVPAGSDACISDRADAPSGGGDARLTVVSVSAGQWNLAAGAAVPPRLSIGNSSVIEGNAGTTLMQLAVSLSAPSALPVSVHFASADGTAKAGSDYVATSGTLTLPPGENQALVPVTVNGDTTVEPGESFTMNLSSPSGATISDGVGTAIITDDDAVVPTAPRSLRATPDNAGVVLQWVAPASNGGRPIVGYVVTPYVGGVAGTPRVFTTAATSHTVSALANGTTYTFDVAATNSVGTGARSAKSVPITVGAPVAPVVKAVGSSTQAVVTWSAPVNNGFAVTSYVVRVYRAGVLLTAKTHTVTCTQPCTPARTWTVTGLTNGTNHTFTVEPHNSQGAGPRGTTTILVSATPSAPGRPGTPKAQAGADSVTISWAAPTEGTATINDYLIDVYENGIKRDTVDMRWRGTTYTFRPVTAGVAYSYTVQARNAVGAGPKSALSNSVTPT
jgi:hypothetical protein